jgi:hypothetical protein
MFFLDKPYVSDFLKSTLKENLIPVVGTESLKELDLGEGLNIISEEEAIKLAKKSHNLSLYCTSENSIGWIAKNLDFCEIPNKIELFKDKIKFRKLIKTSLKEEVKQSLGLYPLEVINVKEFIIEECIEGDEYAVDVYFNALGEPVILNILEHIFFSDSDVGDRIYSTSREIIEKNLEEFTSFMKDIGKLAQIKNFPLHVELRRDKKDELYSIVVLDNSTGVSTSKVKSFDYEKLLSKFEEPLELRKICKI